MLLYCHRKLAPPPTHIRGLVLDQQTSAPLDGIRVQLIDESGSVREALTKQTGGFEFEAELLAVTVEHRG